MARQSLFARFIVVSYCLTEIAEEKQTRIFNNTVKTPKIQQWFLAMTVFYNKQFQRIKRCSTHKGMQIPKKALKRKCAKLFSTRVSSFHPPEWSHELWLKGMLASQACLCLGSISQRFLCTAKNQCQKFQKNSQKRNFVATVLISTFMCL